MNTKTEKAKLSTSDLFKASFLKLEKAKAARDKAIKKVSDLTRSHEVIAIKDQKEQLRTLGVSNKSDFDALVAHANRTGFKSTISISAPAPVSTNPPPVSAKPAAPISTTPAR